MSNLTKQQEAVVAAAQAGESLAVRAVAGSGKTTTLVAALQRPRGPTLCLAFNKRNAQDLQAKMPASISCKTLNALGHAAVMRGLARQVTLDDRKLWKLLPQVPGFAKRIYGSETDVAADVVKGARIAKFSGITSGYKSPPPDKGLWEELCQQYDVDCFKTHSGAMAQLLYLSDAQAFSGLIDFDDQIRLPVLFNFPVQQFSCVAVDEAQDLSHLQHRLVDMAMKPSGQLIVVGDPAQAIYSFRGASSDSFHELTAQHSLKLLPLTCSFRCPKAVIHEAQRYVPDITSAPNAPEGSLTRARAVEPAPSLAILSRYNAPLIKLAFSALRDRLAVNYLGRDFMSGLKALHAKCPTPAALDGWLTDTVASAKSEGARARARDRYDSLISLHESGNVEAAIASLLATPLGEHVTFSTIHKAKGLEFDAVIYEGYGQKRLGEQEGNIRYVGVTRAKKSLILHES